MKPGNYWIILLPNLNNFISGLIQLKFRNIQYYLMEIFMSRYHKANILFFALYISGMTALMIWQGIGITPDRYVFILLLASLFVKKTRRFLLDWSPFIFILIAYDFLRSFADKLDQRVHYLPMIQLDQKVFGQVPTVFLQQHLFSIGQLHWYDYLATLFYFLHFALPLGFAFMLWVKNREHFKKFTNSLMVLSYGAFITYVVFPASPPWLSAEDGLLPGVTKILDSTLKTFPQRLNLPSIYNNFDPNTVAAVPSLHAAYPFLVFLIGLKIFRKKALFFLPYVLGVWFSVIYLGEHYATDVALGAIYAVAAFYMAEKLGNSSILARSYLFVKEKVLSRSIT